MARLVIPKHIKVPIWKIGYFIMLFSIFKPAYLPNTVLLYAYYAAEALSLGYLLVSTIGEEHLNKKLIFVFLLYYFILGFSTIINEGSLIDLLEEVLTTFLVVLWMNKTVQRDSHTCIGMLMAMFEFLIYVNLITVLIYPNGLYRSIDAIISARYGWFLGHQTLFAMYAGPAVAIAALFAQMNVSLISRTRSALLIIACITQVIIMGSATNIACLLIIGVGTLAMTVARMKRFPYKLFLIALAVIVIMVVILQSTGFLEPFVTNYFHKTMTFTDRTYFWEKSWNIIKNNWLFGIGVHTDEGFKDLIGAIHAHDQYLQCLLEGGIPLLLVFLVIILQTFKKMRKFNHFLSGKVITSALVALLIQMIFEVYFRHTMGKTLIVLSYYLPYFYTAASTKLEGNYALRKNNFLR